MTFAYYACKLTGYRAPRVPDIPPGPALHPGNWKTENSNTPYEYPWGKKTRNPWFIGPFPKDESK